MRTLLSLIALATVIQVSADDILRFTNGDQLHGAYKGINDKGGVMWERKDIDNALTLQPENIRHIILQGAAPQVGVSAHSYIKLNNGDQIPGEVLSLDDKNVSIRSHVIGEITLPTTSISSICPNPFGGKLKYAGPFSADGWEILPVDAKVSKNMDQNNGMAGVRIQVLGAGGNAVQLPQVAPDAEKKEDKEKEAKKEKEEKPQPAWQHNGSAWYHLKGIEPLARKNCLGEKSLIRFRLSWRDRLSAYIAIHADYAKAPEAKEKEEGDDKKNAKNAAAQRQPMVFFNGMPQNLANTFGNALVLNLNQSYFNLSRCGFDADGEPFTRRMNHIQSSAQLPDSGDAVFEIRSDRTTGLMMLFINGQYAAQWEELDPIAVDADAAKDEKVDPPLGNGFGLQCVSAAMPMRLSDMIITDWNGIKDSAYSMSNEHRDIILLGNGTDRYSGEISGIKDNKVFFKNAYSELEIPLEEISEIVFAKKEDSEPEDASAQTVTARFYPTGKISGVALSSDNKQLEINHPNAAKLKVDLSTAITLEFNDENPFLEVMDEKQAEELVPKK